MGGLVSCSVCSGRFGPTIFEDVETTTCRFCMQRQHLKDDLTEANKRIDALAAKLESLQEFVTLNVGVPSAQESSNSSPDPPIRTYANATTTVSRRTPTNTGPRDDFQVVRSNVRPQPRKILPITTCHNRYQILAETDNDEMEDADVEEIRLVGDSMVRSQLVEFCGRAPKSRKRFCIPGGGVDDVTAAVEEVTMQAPANTKYIIHVGTNDVQHTRSEELLSKYRNMIKTFKEKSNNIVLSGILPRVTAEERFFNLATSINRRLVNICKEEGINFIDCWDNFYHDRSLFSRDGVHLNAVGSARFGRLLNNAAQNFLRRGDVQVQPV